MKKKIFHFQKGDHFFSSRNNLFIVFFLSIFVFHSTISYAGSDIPQLQSATSSLSPVRSSFDIEEAPFTVSYKEADGSSRPRQVNFEIAKRQTVLADGTIRIEYEGRLKNEGHENLEGGVVLTSEGTYLYHEEKTGGESRGHGKRTLKIVESNLKTPKTSGQTEEGYQLMNQYEYTVLNGQEFLVHHTCQRYRTKFTYWPYRAPNEPQDIGREKTLKNSEAFIERTDKTYDDRKNLIRTSRDIQKRKTAFYINGDVSFDKTENKFLTQEKKEGADVFQTTETHYGRLTQYKTDEAPKLMKTMFAVRSPAKNFKIISSMGWDMNGELDSVRLQEMVGARLVSEKLWQSNLPLKSSAEEEPNGIYLTDTGVLHLLKLIKNWEQDFANSSLPASPFAFPFSFF